MIVVDDRVIFELSDIRQFSDGMQQALAAAAPPFNTAADFLSTEVNETIRQAKEAFISDAVSRLRPIAQALALQAASQDDLNLARDRLNDARIALGLPLE